MGDFALGRFDTSFEETEDSFELSLHRRGGVWQGDFLCPVILEKKISLPKDGYEVTIDYCIVQRDREIVNIKFGAEFCFNLLAPEAEDRYALINGARPDKDHYLSAVAEARQVSDLIYCDEYQDIGIGLHVDHPATLWRAPIYTVSLSEDGFEKIYQGHSALFLFDKALAAEEEYRLRFKLNIAPLIVLRPGMTGNPTTKAQV
jgi:alpha-amylase